MSDQQLISAATWARHQAKVSTSEGRTKDAALWTQIAREVDDYLAGQTAIDDAPMFDLNPTGAA